LTDMTITEPPGTIPSTMDELVAWAGARRVGRPVYHDDVQNCWHVFRYADVVGVLADPPRFLADLGDLLPSNPDLDLIRKGSFINMDGPRHRKLRDLVAQAFTPKIVAGMEPRVRALTIELLDAVGGADEFDLVDQLAFPLPLNVIAELLGIPAADRPMLRRWAEEFFPFDEDEPDIAGTQEVIDALVPTVREMTAYLLGHIAERRARPREDLTTRLIAAEIDGQRIDDEEMVGLIGLLLTAGHITTAALLSHAVVTLDEHPQAAAELRADHELLPTAVEELLRWRPPVPKVTRRSATEVTVGGQRIPRDEILALWLVSANMDEAKFTEPDRFDIRRRPNPHVSFSPGIHRCLGAPLARLEARVVLGLLFDRYRTMVVGRSEFHHPFALNSGKYIGVRVTHA
jgi:cytochrome P450